MADKKPADKKKKNAGHGFTHTNVEHHGDGSHTVHHVHEDGPHKDVKHAVADHDSMMDSMQEHLGTPNPGEDMAAAPGAPAPASPAGPAVPPAGPAGPMGV
jgi:hypothetical protein